MFERLFRKLKYRFDSQQRINLLCSSNDPGLAEYLKAMKVEASTHMDEKGLIFIKVIDPPSKGTLLEEFAHALQFIRRGNVPLSRCDLERRTRELEVAKCLGLRANDLRLSEYDRDHIRQVFEWYGDENARH